jgi:hypothetical protein
MRRQLSWWVLLASFATTAFILSSCSTVSSRIEADRPAFDALSPQDRALVTEGKIRGGMSPQAVYLAWGGPRQKTTGMVHDQATETWVYTATSAAYGPYYGAGGYGGWGFANRVSFVGVRHGHRFFAYAADPFWDPFYYPFPATVEYPVKTVSFQNGRVVAFQVLAPY